MVDLFEAIEEGVEFSEAANTPIPGGKVVNITYLLILRTGGMVKACEQREDMQFGLKTWQACVKWSLKAYQVFSPTCMSSHC